MIRDFNIKLLTGGYTRVTPSWTMDVNRHDRCFKLYLPLKGAVSLIMDGTPRTITPGSLYFISGWHIERQICEKSMEVIWLHFVPDSLRLQFVLTHATIFHALPAEKYAWAQDSFRRIHSVFNPYDESLKLTQQLRPDVPGHLRCKLQSVILAVISDILEETDDKLLRKEDEAMERFHDAIIFMDMAFLRNPSLREVAASVHMAPTYFHSAFREAFGITPYDYMLNKRMNIAKELLAFSRLSVKEVAAQSGYQDEFHFSKTFKKSTGLSPKAFRSKTP